jgi:uncharacterized membrane protein YpjA
VIRLLRWTLDLILRSPLIFWTCVIANFLGAVYGIVWWYGGMIADSPLWAFPFIPDCPLAALGGSVALWGLRSGKRWSLLYALVAFACIKYGAWTLAFWLRHWSNGGSVLPMQIVLFVSHMGLLAEGLLFVPRIGALSLPKRWSLIGWFALSVFIDYGLGYHPPIFDARVTPEFLFWLAAVLTFVLGVGLLALPRHAARGVVRPATA